MNQPTAPTYYAWDVHNRLTRAEPVGGAVSFSYDGDGRRLLRQDPSQTRRFIYDFDKVLQDRLNVMDATAIVMCRDNNLPLQVFNLFNAGDLLRIVQGEDVGTVVSTAP